MSKDDTEEISAYHDECWDTYFIMITEYSGEDTVNKIDDIIDANDFSIYKKYTINENSITIAFSDTYLFIEQQTNGYTFVMDSTYTKTKTSSKNVERLSIKPTVIKDTAE